MSKIAVTTGGKYVDIDGFACVIAYTELLRLKGEAAVSLVLGPINHSVTQTIRDWSLLFLTELEEQADLVIVDVSDPDYLADFYNLSRVVEIFDHHFGFEKFWEEKLGNKMHIAAVGSCTTLIWEEFKQSGYADKISATSANLLALGIVSNTLNFNASVTDERDKLALRELGSHMNLPKDWIEAYFTETEQEIFKNPKESIKNDTKIQEVKNLHKTFVIGQIELWDSRKFFADHLADITSTLESFGNPDWFMTSPSISEGKNYIYTKSEYIKELFIKHFMVTFSGDVGTTQKLWMRKEILKVLYEI